MLILAIIFGAAVGFSLGLTGGGGSILAVPLLVYGLATAPRQAVGISLAAVGTTALVGAVLRLWRGEVEIATGVMFAIAGMVGAPVGSWIGRRLSETLLLLSFAGLMLWVAVRMWLKATKRPQEASVVRSSTTPLPASSPRPACRRDPTGKLFMTSRCALIMSMAGILTGILSGLYGVGGGFVIVPALVLFSGMGIHRAVATSLLVIAVVSASGLASYLLAHQPLPTRVAFPFVIGGIAGLGLGTLVGRRLSPARLQEVFAIVIIAIAAFVIVKNVV